MHAYNRPCHNITRWRNRVKSVSESGVTRRVGHPKSISSATTTEGTNRPKANTGPNISPPPTIHSISRPIYPSIYPMALRLCPANLRSPAFIRTPAAGALRSRTRQKHSNNQTYTSEDGVNIRYIMCVREIL